MTRTKTWNRKGLVLVVLLALAAALIGAYVLSGNDDPAANEDDATPVTLFLPYVPNIQFAPVYVAVERGYFAEEGIALTFEHNFNESDGLERLAAGDLQFAVAGGEQVLLARGRGRPLVYVYEWFERFPVGVASPADLAITTPQDLAGRVVGFPGVYGTSYVGLRALLDAAGMTEADLGELRAIGFTAPENICTRSVDAALVYVVNEPLAIERECMPVNVIEVSDYATLVSNGLITNEQTIRDDPALVRGMVRALARGLADTIADPDAAFTLSVENVITDLPESQYDIERQVLANSITLWESDRPGWTEHAAWEATQSILVGADLMEQPLPDVSAAYDMSFLPAE